MQVSTHRKQKKRKCRFLHVDNIHNDHRARLGRGSRPGQSLPHGRSRTCPRVVCIDPRQAPRGRSRRECPHGQSDCHCPRLNLILLCVCVCVCMCVFVCVLTTQHSTRDHNTRPFSHLNFPLPSSRGECGELHCQQGEGLSPHDLLCLQEALHQETKDWPC